jgi:hypothetical protein
MPVTMALLANMAGLGGYGLMSILHCWLRRNGVVSACFPLNIFPCRSHVLSRQSDCSAALSGPASALLDFNFSFLGIGFPIDPAAVMGIVDGLVDNVNDQNDGVIVTIASATNGPEDTIFTFADYLAGQGFDVASGQITNVDIGSLKSPYNLYLGNLWAFFSEIHRSSFFI